MFNYVIVKKTIQLKRNNIYKLFYFAILILIILIKIVI